MRNVFTSILITLSFTASVAAATPAYHVASTIPMPDGGWDYTKIDPLSDRLFVARSDGATIVDLGTRQVVGSLGPVAHGHAVMPMDDGRTLVVTSGKDDSVRFFDIGSGRETASIKAGEDPDAAISDPATGKLLVMNAHGGTVSVIDPRTRVVERTIALKPGLEYAALDRTGILFVNNEDLNQMEVLDPRNGKVAVPITLTGCEGPTGLGYDRHTGKLIAACANGKAAVVDAAARRQIALLDIGQGPDAVIVDEARRYAFIPCGRDGTLTVIALDAPSHPRVVATVKTEVGARTAALDPRDGAIYLPTARFGAPQTPGGRPTAIAGSVHLVVVRP